MKDVRKRILNIELDLKKRFFEREDVIRGLLIGLLSRQHVLLLGPPGEGKTELVTELCSGVTLKCFHWLVGKTTTPEEIFGPLSIKNYIENERYEYSTNGKLPTANIAFLDEIFKCNSAVLNLLLDIMENRRFHNGTTPQQVPLHMMVGASNEMPEEGEGLEALWDRFSLRYVVKPIQAKKNFLKMIQKADKKLTGNDSQNVYLTLDELQEAQAKVKEIAFGKIGEDLLGQVWEAMREKGFVISDRKYSRAVDLMKANAFLAGRTEVNEEDLEILAHSFWNEEEQRLEIAKMLIQMSNPLEMEARELLDASVEIYTVMNSEKDEDRKYQLAQEANVKLLKAKQRLEALIDEAKKTGKTVTKIKDAHKQVDEMNQQAVGILLGWS